METVDLPIRFVKPIITWFIDNFSLADIHDGLCEDPMPVDKALVWLRTSEEVRAYCLLLDIDIEKWIDDTKDTLAEAYERTQ